ncbi:nitrile hydratase accessory protein [Asaia sp. As-1742]|uniref:nitrile hydratase accessory protein n=1 Tax=Asaia sp. As-1742 TaxID=2608325 RepID=UPI00141DDA6E|nr:nitrile hydratase accessory protein [Asaia sp. As-1742]
MLNASEVSPCDHEESVARAIPMETAPFGAPWHARVWGLAVHLHETGLFSWPEWVNVFSRTVAALPAEAGECVNDTYYRQWASALESLLSAKGYLPIESLDAKHAAWLHAHLHTPHGMPVILQEHGITLPSQGAPTAPLRGVPIHISPAIRG